MKTGIYTALLCMWISVPFVTSAQSLKPYTGDPDAPPLILDDINGIRWELSKLRGQVVLVNFWATWCTPCLKEMPAMERLKQKMTGRPFVILGVDMGESREAISTFLATTPVTFPILLDSTGKAVRDWKVFAVPTSYLVDSEGHVRYGLFGAVEWDQATIVGQIEGVMPDAVPARGGSK